MNLLTSDTVLRKRERKEKKKKARLLSLYTPVKAHSQVIK
jgi:hypothetical protein